MKRQHLWNLAQWTGWKASIPSLGLHFGHRLANCAEAMETPFDPSLFLCQRCESILHPGYNCTIRVEICHAPVCRRHKKLNNPTQSNVVYTCHFCLQWNLKNGTSRGHIKEICASRPRPASELKPVSSTLQKSTILDKGVYREMGNDKVEEIISLEETLLLESKSGGLEAHLATSGQAP